MIRFTLRCENGHGFESWFRSNDGFDALQSAGQVMCPDCGATAVTKAPMAPRVTKKDSAAVSPAVAMAELRKHVEENSDYVGNDFVREARKIHDGEAPERSIYGEAKIEDAKRLVDDGIPAMPLPFVPKRKTN